MQARRDKIIEAIQANEAWMRLVYRHPWSDPEPPDVRAIEAEIVRLLRHEQPVPPFAQKWLVDWYSPRRDLGRGEDGVATRKFRTERRHYEIGLKIAEKVTNGGKSIDDVIEEILGEERVRQGKRSWASAKRFMHPDEVRWLDRLADRRRRNRVQPEVD